jgi:hypothetical protein
MGFQDRHKALAFGSMLHSFPPLKVGCLANIMNSNEM